MSMLPRQPFERIFKKVGAKRVSQSALDEMSKVMEEELYKIAKEAALLAKHVGRKTILDEDVRLARRKI
jgi:histone H3/H4